MHVSTYKDWKDLGHWYWGLVKDQFDLDDETRKLAKKITEGKTTDVDKVKAVYEWVTKNTRYVALEFGIYGYKPRRCVQTVARGWGDCKDKATVITTLLNELGIKTTMVVLRTQMKGDFRSSIASFAPFDHAIAYVPSMNLYLDGTAELTGINELPRMDIGALGLLVNEGQDRRSPTCRTSHQKRISCAARSKRNWPRAARPSSSSTTRRAASTRRSGAASTSPKPRATIASTTTWAVSSPASRLPAVTWAS